MDKMDVFYRAYKEYRELVKDDASIAQFRDALDRASSDADRLASTRTYAIIDEEWVKEIEAGMIYVEKAVREDRQFIRQYGEVLPIEKIKRVSHHSVKHLARHSELITREPEEGDDLIPDHLYMVENLSDYAVYENRFLFMLLHYVSDFITIRLDKILELGRTYKAELTVKKEVKYERRHFTLETKMYDCDKNDSLSDGFGNLGPLIKRIQDQRYMAIMLLNTPLMQEVAKTPMLKPPITKTNVLRMNNNFKHAYELYHFLASYDKLGYEIKEIKNVISPFNERLLDDYNETIVLSSMVAYQHANKLSNELQSRYLIEEKRRKKEADDIEKKRLADLKNRVQKSGKSVGEYMLLLEKRNKELELDRVKLNIQNERIKQLDEQVAALNTEVKNYQTANQSLKSDFAAWADKYEKDINALNALHEENLIAEQNRFSAELQATNDEWQGKIDERISAYEAQINNINLNHVKEIGVYNAEKERIRESNVACEYQIKQLIWRNTLILGELNAIRAKYDLMPVNEDFSSKERFKELEAQFEAFTALFKTEWEKTKRRIKREIMGVYPTKNFNEIDTRFVDVKGKSIKADNLYKESSEFASVRNSNNLGVPPSVPPELNVDNLHANAPTTVVVNAEASQNSTDGN